MLNLFIVIKSLIDEKMQIAIFRVPKDHATRLGAIEPTDEDLESVYGYLTQRARGVRR